MFYHRANEAELLLQPRSPFRVKERVESRCPTVKSIFQTLRKALSAPVKLGLDPSGPIKGFKLDVSAHNANEGPTHGMHPNNPPFVDVGPHDVLNQTSSPTVDDGP